MINCITIHMLWPSWDGSGFLHGQLVMIFKHFQLVLVQDVSWATCYDFLAFPIGAFPGCFILFCCWRFYSAILLLVAESGVPTVQQRSVEQIKQWERFTALYR